MLAILGAVPGPASASPAEPTSIESALRSIGLALKAQGKKAIKTAGDFAADGQRAFAKLEERLSDRLEDAQAALSARKARLERMGEDAAASVDIWRQAASHAWTQLQRSAADAFGRLADWMRPPSAPEEQSEVRV